MNNSINNNSNSENSHTNHINVNGSLFTCGGNGEQEKITLKPGIQENEKEEKLGAEIGSVFIQYSNVKGAENAYQNMSNKKYNGNEISIIFVPLYVFINEIVLKEDKDDNEKDKNQDINFDNNTNF